MIEIFQRKKLFLFIISFSLFLFAVFLAIQLNPVISPSILSQDFSHSSFSNWKTSELLKGQRVDGEFKAKENNLGIISIRFNTFSRSVQDSVIFRVKESNDTNWRYENVYKTDQFQQDKQFTFGFPMFENSKGHVFNFEIESTTGKPLDAVALSSTEPVLTAYYQFTKLYFFRHKQEIPTFLFQKLLNLFSNFSSGYYFLLCLVLGIFIFVGYFLWIFGKIKFRSPIFLMFIFTIFMAISIIYGSLLFLNTSIFFLSIFWLFICMYYSFPSKTIFVMGLISFLLSILIKIAGFTTIAEFTIDWLFVFFLLGLFQVGLDNVNKYVKVYKNE